jgi:hypothetical protein
MSCVYVLKSLRCDKEGETSYSVYKIGKTSKDTSKGRANVTTMSANDIDMLTEINTENGKKRLRKFIALCLSR